MVTRSSGDAHKTPRLTVAVQLSTCWGTIINLFVYSLWPIAYIFWEAQKSSSLNEKMEHMVPCWHRILKTIFKSFPCKTPAYDFEIEIIRSCNIFLSLSWSRNSLSLRNSEIHYCKHRPNKSNQITWGSILILFFYACLCPWSGSFPNTFLR